MAFQHPLDQLSIRELLGRLFGFSSVMAPLDLHEAAQHGDEDVVRQVIKSASNLDTIDAQGRSALQLAAQSGCSSIFAVLIEAGASTSGPLLPPVSVADVCFLCFRVARESLYGLLLAWLASKLYIPVPLFLLRRIGLRVSALLVAAPILRWFSAKLISRSYPSAASNARIIINALSAFKGDTLCMSTLFIDSDPDLEIEDILVLWSHAVGKGYTGICHRLLRMGFPPDALYCHSVYPDVITALHHASGAGNRELVILLLNNGADPTILDSHGRSCLLLASAAPYTEYDSPVDNYDAILEILLRTDAIEHLNTRQTPEAESDPEVPDFSLAGRHGWPLADAAQNIRNRGVGILLEAGADPNLKTDSGFTALHAACRWHVPEIIEIVRLLVRYGADVNAVSDLGWTPLGCAASIGSFVEILDILVEAGANLESTAGDVTALQSAARHDISGGQVMKYLARKGADVNATGGKLGSVLLGTLERAFSFWIKDDGSTQTGDDPQPQIIDFVLELLEHGLDLNLVPEGWPSPLETAAQRNRPLIVSFLLDNGAQLPKFKGKGKLPSSSLDESENSHLLRTDFHKSILSYLDPYNPEIFRILLDHGVSPDADLISPVEMTILGAACTSASDECLETATLLLEHGADSNFRDREGHLPIQRAAFAGSLRHLQKLVEHGSSVQTDESEYGSLLHSLCKGYAKEVFSQRKSEEFLDCFRFLDIRLPHGSVWTKDGSARTCLHYLAEKSEETALVMRPNRTTYVKDSSAIPFFLTVLALHGHPHPLERIPNPSLSNFMAQDSAGLSVFHIASQKGDSHVMRSLVQHVRSMEEARGAQGGLTKEMVALTFMTQPDKRGWTALHHAASKGRALACNYILEATKAGAACLVTADGKTAQDLANENHHYGIAEYIDKYSLGVAGDEIEMRKAESILVAETSKTIYLEFSEDQLLDAVREQSDRLASIQDR